MEIMPKMPTYINYKNIDLQTFLKIRHEIPKEQLYNATINVYMVYGTNGFPVDVLIAAKDLRPKNYLRYLPSRLKNEDIIRMFRDSTTPPEYIDELREEFSWTIHTRDTRYYAAGQRFIYCGETDKNDIIGYTIHAHQVIPYNSVYNVEYLPPQLFEMYTKLYEPCECRDKLEEEG